MRPMHLLIALTLLLGGCTRPASQQPQTAVKSPAGPIALSGYSVSGGGSASLTDVSGTPVLEVKDAAGKSVFTFSFTDERTGNTGMVSDVDGSTHLFVTSEGSKGPWLRVFALNAKGGRQVYEGALDTAKVDLQKQPPFVAITRGGKEVLLGWNGKTYAPIKPGNTKRSYRARAALMG